MNKNDKLVKMFEMQKFLQKHLTNAELPADRPDLVSYHALGLFTELGEVLQADKRWKLWSEADKSNNIEEVKSEIADCWLFLINLTLVHNIDANELFDLFLNKHNKVRAKNKLEEENWNANNIRRCK